MNTEFLEKIPEANWDRMAAVSGIDRVELKRKIKEGLQHYELSDPPQITITRPLVEDSSPAQPKPFEFELGLGSVVSLKGLIFAHIRSVEDFRIEVKFTITVASIPVDSGALVFDQNRLRETWDFDVPFFCAGGIAVGWRIRDKQVCSTFGGHISFFGRPPLKLPDTDLICLP